MSHTPAPIFHGRHVHSSWNSFGASKKSAWGKSRGELSEDVSFDVGTVDTLLVVGRSIETGKPPQGDAM